MIIPILLICTKTLQKEKFTQQAASLGSTTGQTLNFICPAHFLFIPTSFFKRYATRAFFFVRLSLCGVFGTTEIRG